MAMPTSADVMLFVAERRSWRRSRSKPLKYASCTSRPWRTTSMLSTLRKVPSPMAFAAASSGAGSRPTESADAVCHPSASAGGTA